MTGVQTCALPISVEPILPPEAFGDVDTTTGEITETPQGEVASLTPSPARPAVTGRDGKTYPRPEPSKPRRSPLPDSFWRVTHDLTRKVNSLVNLTEDDRFPQNAEKVATANRSDLIRAIDALQRVVDRLDRA